MRKKSLIIFGSMLFSVIAGSLVSCGPSKEELARMDSIRIADSLRVVDSIRVADSIAEVRRLEAEAELLNNKVDEVAASLKNKKAVKFTELCKVVYDAGVESFESTKKLCIMNVATGDVNTLSLPSSTDWTGIVEIEKKDEKTVKVTLHCGGSGPFYQWYIIDVENEKVKSRKSDFD